MKVAIIDDDIVFLKKFHDMIIPYFNKSVITLQSDIIHFKDLSQLNDFDYDIVFLDIDLKTYSGIDIATYLKEIKKNIIIIFISSRNELVFNSLVAQPFQFIRKSNLIGDLQTVMILLDDYLLKNRKFIKINLNDQSFSINLQDIIYIESNKHNVSIVTYENVFTFRCSLKDLLLQINSTSFIQIQKSVVINCTNIDHIYKHDVFLKNGNIFSINRYYLNEFKKKYKDFLLK